MNSQFLSTVKIPGATTEFHFHYLSELLKRPVCTGKIQNRIGRVDDLVCKMAEPYPEVVGIYIWHGWGKPTELIPWDKVLRIEDDAIFVAPPPDGGKYPPLEEHPDRLPIYEHLIGRTILDMDGRRVEVVNDVHLLESGGRMLLVHVDISFNGFLRKLGLGRLCWRKDDLISWHYVQPLSVKETVGDEAVSLSVTRKQIKELPSEDLADALEELSGREQQALLSVLDDEKAADTLMDAEPRAQRQIIANLRKERMRMLLTQISVPQLADLFTVLPHDESKRLMEMLPPENAERIQTILSNREVTASTLITPDCFTTPRNVTVGELLRRLRGPGISKDSMAYAYVVNDEKILLGVADLRDLLSSPDDAPLESVMAAPVVSAQATDMRDDLIELFARYHFRMIPVVDEQEHLLGVVHHRDVMRDIISSTNR